MESVKRSANLHKVKTNATEDKTTANKLSIPVNKNQPISIALSKENLCLIAVSLAKINCRNTMG
jgi:hypothetical protein